jgi:glycerol-3-phosphate O-acyltransferase/dihydroxyacetone phosphate acyltransferase
MIIYRVLRRVARIALAWYYADLEVERRDRIPAIGPVLIVANHPNALVDAMVIAVAVPRRVLLTAKATLFEQPLLAALLRTVGVVPLRRAKDEQTATTEHAAPTRNADAFRAVTTALAGGGVVLVFPEGISHDAPTLAPLRTGAARMALMAHAAGVRGLRLVAAGLIYEEKERPRSRILTRFNEPLELDAWIATRDADATVLTAELEARLRRVTLNFATEERARDAMRLARTMDALGGDVSSLGRPRQLASQANIAQRVDEASAALTHAPASVVTQARALMIDTEAFEQRLGTRGVSLSELRISPAVAPGAWFVVREAMLLALAAPVALVDRLAHDIPVRIARAHAQRSLARDPSRDQPAMQTIIVAAALLLVWYLALGAMLAHWLGWTIAILAVAVMLMSASAELALRDRLARAWRRARTYLAFRSDPTLRETALAEADRLVNDAMALEDVLRGSSGGNVPDAPQAVR